MSERLGRPLDGAEIRDILVRIADAIDEHFPQQTVVLIGGAYMALHGWRESTRDIDSAVTLSAGVQDAVGRVAAAVGLNATFMNAHAVAFVENLPPVVECEVLLDHPRLRVVAPPPDYIFLLKLRSARPGTDRSDMVRLLPHCAFQSVDDVVDRFWKTFPNERADAYLTSFVAQVARSAGVALPGADTTDELPH